MSGELERGLMVLLIVEPTRDVIGETGLRERLFEESFEFGGDCEPVDGGRFLLGISRESFALNETALDGKERG